MPPPNITGQLHMGHALFITLQDTLIRFHRMRGANALWIPGTDHAGIATQEKIIEELGKRGIDATRDNFLSFAAQWKDQYQGRITTQLTRLGASCDWQRERFTLDKQYSASVIEAFNRIAEKGLIYRDKNQWWLDTRQLAERALAALDSGELTIMPDDGAKTYRHYLRNIEPWCLSRQIWWGHQIPAWHDADGNWFIARSFEDACEKAGHDRLTQDEDVLDTWFSSSLWPFAIHGWPQNTEDLARYYPATLIETADDILFFWCARMIMMGLCLTDQLPFRTIYLHGIIRDKFGRKMSKSLGNGIDPLEISQKFGTDALRFALLENSIAGQDMKLGDDKFSSAKRFTTKLWNAARFCLLNTEAIAELRPSEHPDDLRILSLLEQHRQEMIEHLEGYNFHQAARTLRIAIKDEFCDWWIEAAKQRLREGDGAAGWTAIEGLRRILRLAHPFLPFTTEAIWSEISDTQLISESL
jgi:valyl-tRNA synthetase